MKLDYLKGLFRALISLIISIIWVLMIIDKLQLTKTNETIINVSFIIILIYWFLEGLLKNSGVTKLLEAIAKSKLIKNL